ncbi:MAG: hypothetical protein V4582_18010 [Pseudomonadota bacterium]
MTIQRLQLETDISADLLAQIEDDLARTLFGWLLGFQHRVRSSPLFRRLLRLVVMPLCAAGFALSLLVIWLSWRASEPAMLAVGVVLALVFVALAIIVWNKEKYLDRFMPRLPGYWMWVARLRARRMLTVAKRAAPFTAEYDCRGDLACYFRVKDDGAKFIWSRKLAGYYLGGRGYTLFYKHAGAIYPNAIILHGQTGALHAYLDALGLHVLPAPEPQGQ